MKNEEYGIIMKKMNDVTNKLHNLAKLRIKNFDKIKYKRYNDKYINFSKKNEDSYSEDN